MSKLSANAPVTKTQQNKPNKKIRPRKAPRLPEADILAADDAVTTNSRKPQQKKVRKLVTQGRHAAQLTGSLDQLPEMARPPGPDDPLGQRETEAFAKA